MYLFWHVVYWSYLASPTLLRIHLSPHGQQGITRHVVPLLHVVLWSCLASPTPSRIYLSSHWQQGITCHVVPLLHVVSWPCLALPILSMIYLFPLWATGNDASHSTSFACGLLAQWVAASSTHSRIYPFHAKWDPPTWLVVTKTGLITRHKDVVTKTG